MKTLLYTSIIALTLAGTCQAGLVAFFTSERRDWNHIQAIGGMKVALAGRQLDVTCNVSGIKTVTVKPSQINSAHAVRKLKARRDGDTIKLSLYTCVYEKGKSAETGGIDLSNYPAGSYAVVYADKDGTTHPLADIELPAQ